MGQHYVLGSPSNDDDVQIALAVCVEVCHIWSNTVDFEPKY